MNISFEQAVTLIGVVGGLVTLIVGISTLASRRDSKTASYAKTEQALSSIQTNVSEMRVDIKSGFRDVDRRLASLESRICSVETRTELQQQAINKAHERIDEMKST